MTCCDYISFCCGIICFTHSHIANFNLILTKLFMDWLIALIKIVINWDFFVLPAISCLRACTLLFIRMPSYGRFAIISTVASFSFFKEHVANIFCILFAFNVQRMFIHGFCIPFFINFWLLVGNVTETGN